VALPLRVPIAGRLIAAASGWPQSCGESCVLRAPSLASDPTPRILLKLHAEARMQSPARLSARTPDRRQSVSALGSSSQPSATETARPPASGADSADGSGVSPAASGETADSSAGQGDAGMTVASDVYAPTMQSTPQGSGPVAGALPTTHRSEPASVEVMSGPPEGQGPLRPEEIGGEIWAPGACGIAPG
jgi:hypothetical protein